MGVTVFGNRNNRRQTWVTICTHQHKMKVTSLKITK